MKRWAGAMIVGLLLLPATAHALVVTGLGFSFDLPEEWKAISRSDIRGFLEQGKQIKASPAELMAYQPAAHKRAFEPPYVLVKTTSHPGSRVIESMTEKEIRQILSGMAGVENNDAWMVLRTPRVLPTEPLPPVPRDGKVYFTLDPPYFVTDTTNLGEKDDALLRQIGAVGKSQRVIISIVGKAGEAEEDRVVARKIENSFRWNPSQVVALNPGFWRNYGTPLMLAAVIFVICVGAGLYLIRWFRGDWKMEA